MKITITNYNRTYSAETEEDSDVESVADMFKGLLVGMGYHPTNVDEIFNTEYKWFTQEEIDENRQGHLKGILKTPKDEQEKLERLCRDKKVQEFQDNMYNPTDTEDDIFS